MKNLSTLTEDQILVDRANTLIRRQHLHRDPSLSLVTLAKLLGVSRSTMSRAINRHTGMHYNQYINMFRIRDVVELLRESIHDPLVSVDTIYLRAGFLSQSTYYKVFKDVMHFSPVVFKKKLAQAYRQNP